MKLPVTIPQPPTAAEECPKASAAFKAGALFSAWQSAYRRDLAEAAKLRRDLLRLGNRLSPKSPHRLVPRPARWSSAPRFSEQSGRDKIAIGTDDAAPIVSPKTPGPFANHRGDAPGANRETLRDPLLKPDPEQITRGSF